MSELREECYKCLNNDKRTRRSNRNVRRYRKQYMDNKIHNE